MSSRPDYDALIDRILDGEDFRLERDDRTIIDFDTRDVRTLLGLRLWMRTPGGRWSRTKLNLTPNTKDPDTVASILRSYAAVLDHWAGVRS